jgi:hypothetical protein
MRHVAIGAVVLAFAAIAPSSAIASPVDIEALLGLTVNGSTAVTGGTTISPLGSLGSAVVAAGPEFGFCVGPNLDNCVSSGLAGNVDLSDTQVTFNFAGSTLNTTGSFIVTLNFLTPIIQNVSFNSGSLLGGTFGLTSFTPTQMVFTGSVGGGGSYNAIGGRAVSFNVAAIPEPGTLFLLGSGLVGVRRLLRRRHSLEG